MHIRQAQDITPLHTGHGEVVRELGGHSAGGLQKHSMAEITLPPGVASLKHYHPEVEESYYILEGQPRIEIDDRAIQLSPGQLVAIPVGSVHQIFNDSAETVRLLVSCAPAWTPDCSVFVDD